MYEVVNMKYKNIEVTEEDVSKGLKDREGGRKAGRGDSPYSQEEYERLYGLKKAKR